MKERLLYLFGQTLFTLHWLLLSLALIISIILFMPILIIWVISGFNLFLYTMEKLFDLEDGDYWYTKYYRNKYF